MKKRLIAILLVLVLILPVLSFTGCADKKTEVFIMPSFEDAGPEYKFDKNVKTHVRADVLTHKLNETADTKYELKDTIFKLVDENNLYEFYFCEETLEIALKSKATGEFWYSNPAPSERDAGIKIDMASQLNLFFLNKKDGSQKTYYSFQDCVNKSDPKEDKYQYYVTTKDGNLRVIYIIGQVKPQYVIPICLEGEMALELAAKFKESKEHRTVSSYLTNGSLYAKITPDVWNGWTVDARQEYLKVAPLIEDYIKDGKTVYIIKDLTKLNNEKLMRKIQSAFVEVAEMNMEDRDEINASFGYEEEPAISFWIPVDYELTATGLKATIPNNEIKYDTEALSLVSIDFLKYFGSASKQENGYMFVPDGSGAIINFNNGKTNITSDLRVQLYGLDDGRETLTRPYSTEGAYLPVFGIKRANTAMFAIIESGDTNATVVADIAGKNATAVDRNRCYTSFKMNEYEELQFKNQGKKSKIYQQFMNSADLSIHYSILEGEKANYNGMAEYYRNYLLDKNVLSKKDFKDVPFNIELVGAYDHDTAFLGVPYKETKAITTFEGCKAIIEKLNKAGITNVSINYKGWANGGLRNTVFNKVKVLKELGGKKGLEDLLAYADQLGVNLYLEAELAFVYNNSMFSGYSELTKASRLVTRNVAYHYQYLDDWNTAANDNAASIVSPTVIYDINAEDNSKSFSMKVLNDLNELKVKGVSLGSLGYNLPGNYKIKDFSDRDKVSKIYAEVAKQFGESMSVMAKGTNYYMLPYVDNIFEISNTSSKFNLADISIPFYQMVIHGSIQYSGDPINLDGDTRQVFLQSVEAGSGMYYRWCYSTNDEVQDLWFEGMYSLSYESWIDQAIEMYKEYNDLLSSVAGEFMVSHEVVAEDVTKVTYSNGVAVYVNYNSFDYTAQDGTIVKAESFAKGGAN